MVTGDSAGLLVLSDSEQYLGPARGGSARHYGEFPLENFSSERGCQHQPFVFLQDTLFLDFTRRGNYTLARAPAAVHLERRIDVDPMLGICYNQKPTLQGVPSHVCEDLQCLWLESLQLNIDVSRNPLRVLPGPSEFKASQCSLPQGGQLPLMSDERPFISFILTMHNHPQITAQCLLELFRTSHEAPSAEYVIIDDGSTEDTSPMTQVRVHLYSYPGIFWS